ncbi:MAG: 2,3-bisphosphoglycerate-independent phosphoglycerate mutase [Candidatus Caenarcaniphilales bacterium]|nr:2,3-bisphosphoglycerate-independent phosphoglycerate mutase [Candidatus Caenarcaniphilales bacterium]
MSQTKKSLLVILDGWGINPDASQSAIAAVDPPFFKQLLEKYPNSRLRASGEAVGLPEGVMGNSEVGHENIGAGRVAKQKLTLISETIKNKKFFENRELLKIFEDVKNNKANLHIMGLLSEGDVHSHLGHMYALIDWAEKEGINYFVHPILDGRDDPPKNAKFLLEDLLKKVNSSNGLGKIADICGRYWAMDRDNNWNRVQKYWDLVISRKGLESQGPLEAVDEAYNREKGKFSPQEDSDEFIQPTFFKGIDGRIKDGDGVIFFNFRPDRARQISTALTQNKFDGFLREVFPKINYVCLTPYDRSIHESENGADPVVPVAFTEDDLPAQDREMGMGEYISSLGLKQLRTAETEKFRHVTSFFNQGQEEPFEGEERILVPSPKVATYDLKPEMSAYEITDNLVKALQSDKFDLIVVNYANADMVGHSGIFEAAKKAVEHLDICLKKVIEAAEEKNVSVLVTADHGNADQMVNKNGSIRTAHSLNEVPCILIDKRYIGKPMSDGALCDLAPTLLTLMGLAKPSQMSGKSLV